MSSAWAICLLAALAMIGGASCSLQLMPVMNETERYVNETFMVTCHGTGAKNTTWTAPSGQKISNNKGRVHVEERTDEGNDQVAALVFERITREDKGNYTCLANINGEDVRKTFALTVVTPITFQGTPSEQNATENQNYVVRCEVTGDPPPLVAWHFKGTTLHGDRYKAMPAGLYISNVTHEDAGEYQCRAYQTTSQTSKIQFMLVKLNVLHKPYWIHAESMASGNASFGDKEVTYGYFGGLVNLSCEAAAHPEAQIAWSRNNLTLEESNTNISILNEPNRSVLQILLDDEDVFGEYECVASNPLGEIARTVEVAKGTKPEPPGHVKVDEVGLNSALIHIAPGGEEQDPQGLPLLGYRIEFTPKLPAGTYNWDNPEYQDVAADNGGSPYTLVGLAANTEYAARVAAKNLAGLGDFSSDHFFRTTNPKNETSGCQALASCSAVIITALVLTAR